MGSSSLRTFVLLVLLVGRGVPKVSVGCLGKVPPVGFGFLGWIGLVDIVTIACTKRMQSWATGSMEVSTYAHVTGVLFEGCGSLHDVRLQECPRSHIWFGRKRNEMTPWETCRATTQPKCPQHTVCGNVNTEEYFYFQGPSRPFCFEVSCQ